MIKQQVYFLGIGGIGMSALAQYFVQQGHDVFGYDGIASEITEKLSQIGATVHHRDSIESIPAACIDKSKTTVVYTPAMSEDSPQFGFFKSTGFTFLSVLKCLVC